MRTSVWLPRFASTAVVLSLLTIWVYALNTIEVPPLARVAGLDDCGTIYGWQPDDSPQRTAYCAPYRRDEALYYVPLVIVNALVLVGLAVLALRQRPRWPSTARSR